MDQNCRSDQALATGAARLPVWFRVACMVPMESPKKTFRLMVDALCLHRKLAMRLERVGFRVRQIVRQEIHPVWQAHLNRGSVPVGTEENRLRIEICSFLKAHGTRCKRKEVEVSVRGDRLQASFLWSKGNVGWMSFYGGRREWHSGYQY